MNSTPELSPLTHNPSTDCDELAYRLCELCLQKMQNEARAIEPDIPHVLACNSVQKMAQQDLLRRLETPRSTVDVRALRLRSGTDDALTPEDAARDKGSTEMIILELERMRRKSEIARVVCFQHIKEM